jgi:hypothetical protein
MYSFKDPTVGVALDCFGNGTVSVANGGNLALYTTSGGYFIGVRNTATGKAAIYFASAATVAMLIETGGEWVAPTTTPAAGKSSIAYASSNYRIYNNSGGATTFVVSIIRF